MAIRIPSRSTAPEVTSWRTSSFPIPVPPIRRVVVLSHLKKPDSKSLLRFRTVTGQDFWEKKIADPDNLKTRQAEYSKSVPTDPRVIFYESMSGARMMDSPY